ncbi:MAG: hypothetical protein ABI591_33745 [Kofleriaceae bacterium]
MGTRHVWLMCVTACGAPSAVPDAGAAGDVSTLDGSPTDAAPGSPPTLTGDRDRLLADYAAFLQTRSAPQSNGLGNTVHSACDVWAGLVPSARGVFLTITHRLYGSELADTTRMLDHVTRLYRIAGGDSATATDPGSCGGGEFNRMIMREDSALHAAQQQANAHRGAQPYDLADVIAGGYWRDSHDAGGPHGPFDLSDETNGGAPRGQTQYFVDPTSAIAHAALGRQDLVDLVDPYALEIDQDYDCTHNSNPDCSYTFYGSLCAPETSLPGTQLYTQSYGDFAAAYTPTGC